MAPPAQPTAPASACDVQQKHNGNERPDNSSGKRFKKEAFPSHLVTVDIESSDSARHLREQHWHSSPFAHGHVPNLFEKDFLLQVVKEIKDNSVVNFKESDLFKVFQSIDFANLDDATHSATMPNVLQLRSILYSAEWRRWVEQLNDLPAGTLSLEQKIDCACNCHLSGCHLLCHDDVIGTRKVSYILYLTEADPPWSAAEGGALELYDSTSSNTSIATGTEDAQQPATKTRGIDSANVDDSDELRIPHTIPAKAILPTFNHMGFFVVQPGLSFHAVQEVLGGRPRLSLQGWYHAATAPSNAHAATLQRLKSYQGPQAVQQEDTEGAFVPFESLNDDTAGSSTGTTDNDDADELKLSSEDRDYLSVYIQDTYLQDDALADIRERFAQDSSVQLRHFLTREWIEKIQSSGSVADSTFSTNRDEKNNSQQQPVDPTTPEYYKVGVTSNWRTVGPAHKQRFLEYTEQHESSSSATMNNDDDHHQSHDVVGAHLHEIRTKLLQSAAFGRFLDVLTTLGRPLSHRGRVRRFRPGRDYTVAHYGLLTEASVLDTTLCFVAGKGGATVLEASSLPNDDDNVADRKQEHKKDGSKKEEDDATEEAPQVEMDEADEIWQSGDCGGFECYIAADDEDDDGGGAGASAADEYNPEDDTELLSVSASNNTLSIVFRDPGTIRFIKYVGSEAPSSRWDVAMEYEVPGGADDNDEDEEQQEELDGGEEEAE